jgi:penicillin G amidase
MRAVPFVEPSESGAEADPSHGSAPQYPAGPPPPVRLFHTPLLRAINLSIAVLALAILAAVYWYGWRSLPQTSGTLSAPIGARATVTRDERGVPHIAAASWQDAIFLQGYATAQDRLWQMDALRRLAAGQLAEVVGKAGLDSDQESHRWSMARIAEAQERNLTQSSREILAAYARGVNFYIETHRTALPPEFAILRYDPRPWSVRDSLLVILQMNRLLTATWREEMNKFQMLQTGDAAKVNFLYPPRTGNEVQPGSNAWAVSGSRSASGKPILANDPHLDWSVPSEWLMVHLKAPDLDVTGVTLPGVPGVIIGHNRRIAWGMTNLGFDVQDLYREQIDMRTGRFLFEGRLQQAALVHDAIQVKGQAPEAFDLWFTRHGPVFLSDGGVNYSMTWMGAGGGPLVFPMLDIDRARNWDEFTAALAAFPGPAQNFVYADVDGNIGYHVAGRLPDRKDCPGDLPLDGSNGQCDWQGLIPFEDLPHAFNPASGMIVTANQNPFPADYPWQVDGRFGSDYRSRQIRARLESRQKWQPADMLAVQKDVYSAFAHFLASQIVAAWDKTLDKQKPAQLRPAVDLLRSWNGQMEKGTAAPLVASLAFDRLRNAVAERASPGHAANYETSYLAPEMVERLLRERPADWFPDYDALLLKCLQEAIAVGEKLQGSKLARWDYGQYNRLTVDHPIFGKLPLLGSYFNLGPVPMSGSSTTVKQTTRRLGPSMRMVVDLSNLDRSLMNITTGESGNVLSGHYMDQWDAYYAGKSFPMEFDQVHASSVLTVTPQ